MRAATVIVGAIAAASILIALAFIISGGDSSKAVTTTVTEKVVEVPNRTEGGGEIAQSAGPTRCDKKLSVEGVSCEVGEQVLSAYEEGHRGLFFPMDTATGETLELNCGEPTPVICKAVEGPATVIFGG
ncbi:MAG TPA: hypothetical protein VJ204_19690 [Solirubrobacterales bacterium]|jgi:hypothetical protein|nr:hypothetical protein [Solirubrobacterales bacterium]